MFLRKKPDNFLWARNLLCIDGRRAAWKRGDETRREGNEDHFEKKVLLVCEASERKREKFSVTFRYGNERGEWSDFALYAASEQHAITVVPGRTWRLSVESERKNSLWERKKKFSSFRRLRNSFVMRWCIVSTWNDADEFPFERIYGILSKQKNARRRMKAFHLISSLHMTCETLEKGKSSPASNVQAFLFRFEHELLISPFVEARTRNGFGENRTFEKDAAVRSSHFNGNLRYK